MTQLDGSSNFRVSLPFRFAALSQRFLLRDPLGYF